MSRASSWVDKLWYDRHPAYRLLLPLSALFGLIAAARRALFRLGVYSQQRLNVPVLVVGNITAGGVGKTPVVIDIVQRLKAAGWRPGVVSRGYGGHTKHPTQVTEHSDPFLVGDEPVLIASKTAVPVVVGAKRAQAARMLSASGVNIIVSDDGLQHYALARDLEICVVDGQRRYGNGQLIPAGPLRETVDRLSTVDLVLVSGQGAQDGEFGIEYSSGPVRQLSTGQCKELSEFSAVQAVAGIGNPDKFFSQLRAAGLELAEYPFSDHHSFRASDFSGFDSRPILMTEKDAVKCSRFRDVRMWALEYHARIDEAAWQHIQSRLGSAAKEFNG